MATRFQSSFYSNPGQPETAVLITRDNPTLDTGSSVRWEAKDGTILELRYGTHEITIVLPTAHAGTTFKPGTKGYSDFVNALAKDWDSSAGMWESYVNWPVEREQIEEAKKKALAAMPETLPPLDKNGNPTRGPKVPGQLNIGLIIGVSMLGLAVVGTGIYFVASRKQRT